MRRAVGYQAAIRRANNAAASPEVSRPVQDAKRAAAASAKPNTSPSNADPERLEQLAGVIRLRIDSRLPGRVRNLKVSIQAGTLVLEGTCATYHTKQLAQHAALGILQDEHLENAIVVSIGR